MGRGRKWRPGEDEALARAYAATTATPEVRGPAFWSALRGRIEDARTTRALKNRWAVIAHDVAAFVDCVARARLERGGEATAADEHTVQGAALALFREATGAAFEFESCWRLLRHCPKFQGGEATRRKRPREGADDDAAASQQAAAAAAEESLAAAVGPETRTCSVAAADTAAQRASAAGRGGARAAEASAASAETADSTACTRLQQLLAEEMKRKNDLQEDQLALQLFAATPEAAESRRFFALLKRKKLLLLERQVEELEQQQRRQNEAPLSSGL